MLREGGEVGEGAFDDLAVLPVGFAEKVAGGANRCLSPLLGWHQECEMGGSRRCTGLVGQPANPRRHRS